MTKKILAEYIDGIFEQAGLQHDDIEEFMGPGRSSDFDGDYDEKELVMGREIEKEHTNNPKIAERIAKDHLAEIPDYYTRLKKMEEEAGIKE